MKYIAILISLLITVNVAYPIIRGGAILDDVTTTATVTVQPRGVNKVFQMAAYGANATESASVTISGSVDGTNFELLDTLTVTMTATPTVYTDYGTDATAWKYLKIGVSEITGTGTATIDLHMSTLIE